MLVPLAISIAWFMDGPVWKEGRPHREKSPIPWFVEIWLEKAKIWILISLNNHNSRSIWVPKLFTAQSLHLTSLPLAGSSSVRHSQQATQLEGQRALLHCVPLLTRADVQLLLPSIRRWHPVCAFCLSPSTGHPWRWSAHSLRLQWSTLPQHLHPLVARVFEECSMSHQLELMSVV